MGVDVDYCLGERFRGFLGKVVSDAALDCPLFPTLHNNVTLEVNGADTALTCSTALGHSTTCTDLTDTVVIPPDSTLSFKVSNTSAGTEDVSISWIASS